MQISEHKMSKVHVNNYSQFSDDEHFVLSMHVASFVIYFLAEKGRKNLEQTVLDGTLRRRIQYCR